MGECDVSGDAIEGLVEAIDEGLRAAADPSRAAAEQRYLKSDLAFLGVRTAPLRRIVRAVLTSARSLDSDGAASLAETLWSEPVFERRAAAVEVLGRYAKALEPRHLALIERFLRESRTWALVDALATGVVAIIVERHPESGAVLDRWAADPDFWIRRSAMLALLPALRRGGGDFERFAGYADEMLEEREFFIRKAIGWVLREVSKERPELVAGWLRPRAERASGVTVREAVKYLAATDREAILAAYRGRGRR